MLATRLASIVGLAAATALYLNLETAAVYLVVHLGVLGLYLCTVEKAAADVARENALARLKRLTPLLSLMMSIPGVALALWVNAHAPDLHVESLCLLITLVMLMALQVHLTTLGFVAAVLPPIMGLLVADRSGPPGHEYPHFAAYLIFTLAALACGWRQKQSDRNTAERAADLADRNAALESALARAEQQRALAESASRAKTDLLAVTSHEIRTPLNAVMAMAAVLRREAPSGRHAELAGNIETAGAMLVRLLNGVLDYVRSDTGDLALNLAPVDAGALIDGVADVWRAQCDAADVHLTLSRQGPRESLIVSADGPRLEQILINLLSNAVKLTPRGGDVALAVEALPAGPGRTRLRFEVADRGPGIAPEDATRIFEAFEQTAEGRKAGGAGLGLAICHRMLGLMGGTIGFDSRDGGGSIFWFELEVEQAEAQAPAPAPQVAEPEEALAIRILAADDNASNREVLRLLLQPLGVELTLVENGAEALEAALARPYDLILMDAQMPVMDGAAAVAAIRAGEAAMGRRTPISMLTANVFPEDIETYMTAGADRVLAKPIDIKALYACLSELALSADDEGATEAA
ncbi:MAG: response regulator [Proteobacteria bacterium]|nr:response regulator [Pseudomonadota bacterium]